MQSSITINLGDVYSEIDFSNIKKYFLIDNSGNTRILVNSNVVNFPSLRKRCKVENDIVYIKLDTDDVNVLCDIAGLCSGVRVTDRIGNTLSFIYSICDESLVKQFRTCYSNIKISSYKCYEEVRKQDTENDVKVMSTPKTTPFEETLTLEQLHELDVDYLLMNDNRCKHALSHPELYNCLLNNLASGIITLANQESRFVTYGKGEISLFTDEYDNLPRLNIALNDESPYKLGLCTGSSIVRKTTSIRTPLNYRAALHAIKREVNHVGTQVKRFLSEGYGVVFGDTLSNVVFQRETLCPIHLCLKDKSALGATLKLFDLLEDCQEEQQIKLSLGYYEIVIHVPNISHVHYVACQPYSLNRMFFDGNELYMTTTCMLTLVNGGYVSIRSEYAKTEEISNMIKGGFTFCKQSLMSIPGVANPGGKDYNWDKFIVEKITNVNIKCLYKCLTGDGYMSSSINIAEI